MLYELNPIDIISVLFLCGFFGPLNIVNFINIIVIVV